MPDLHGMCSLALVSVYLKEQMPPTVFADSFWQVKTFCHFPWLVGLPLESQMCLVGAGYKAVAGSVMGSMVGGLVTRGLGWCGFCFIPWWMGLPPVHCLVGCCWDKGLRQGPQFSPQTAGPLPDVQMGMAPAGFLGRLLSGHRWVPWWAGLVLDWLRGARTEPQGYFRCYSQD